METRRDEAVEDEECIDCSFDRWLISVFSVKYLSWQQNVLGMLKAVRERERGGAVTVVLFVFLPLSQNRYLFLALIITIHVVLT